jgi:hypothetical protein
MVAAFPKQNRFLTPCLRQASLPAAASNAFFALHWIPSYERAQNDDD